MSDWQKTREQLGETDAPGTRAPTLHQRQNLGAASARGPPTLDRHYRFKDLKALGIVSNWPTLNTWIREHGFPPGKLVSPKIRIWSREEIQSWLDQRPSEAA